MDEIVQSLRQLASSTRLYSGGVALIEGTTAVKGNFTAIYFRDVTVFDVAAGGTVEKDETGAVMDISGLAAKVHPAGSMIYGTWTRIKLVSGGVRAYRVKK